MQSYTERSSVKFKNHENPNSWINHRSSARTKKKMTVRGSRLKTNVRIITDKVRSAVREHFCTTHSYENLYLASRKALFPAFLNWRQVRSLLKTFTHLAPNKITTEQKYNGNYHNPLHKTQNELDSTVISLIRAIKNAIKVQTSIEEKRHSAK